MPNTKTKILKEKYSTKGSGYWGILLFAILLLVDMLTKMLADAYFNSEGAKQQIDIIPSWICLRMEYNPGISYGMGANAPMIAKLAVVILTAVLMAVFAVAYFKLDKRRSLLRIALVFLVAGGVGNLIDRVYYRVWELDATAIDQGVRDMVDLSRFGFAVCNFADFFITGGAVMLVLAFLFFDRDAMFHATQRYRALAKEHEAELEEKKAEREKRPPQQSGENDEAEGRNSGQDNG